MRGIYVYFVSLFRLLVSSFVFYAYFVPLQRLLLPSFGLMTSFISLLVNISAGPILVEVIYG